MNVYIYIYIYIHIHITYIYIYIMCVYIYIYIHTHIHTHVYVISCHATYICIYTYIHTYIHIYIYICVCCWSMHRQARVNISLVPELRTRELLYHTRHVVSGRLELLENQASRHDLLYPAIGSCTSCQVRKGESLRELMTCVGHRIDTQWLHETCQTTWAVVVFVIFVHFDSEITWSRGPMYKASAYGAEDCRFESCRDH